MTRFLRSLCLPFLLTALHVGSCFALPLSFSDTVTAPTGLSWTHTLGDQSDDFTPSLSYGGTFEITDADLDIVMTFKATKDDGSAIKSFIVTSSGNTFELGTLEYADTASKQNDFTWHIDLASLWNLDEILSTINSDRSFTVSLEVLSGTLESVGTSILSGNALLSGYTKNLPGEGPIPTHAPEPSSLLLLGAGLTGWILFARKRAHREVERR